VNIALISPPWPLFNRPSIQLACLKAYLSKNPPSIHPVNATAFHPYLALASALGYENYNLISQSSWASESVFACLLYPEILPEAERLFEKSIDRRLKRHGVDINRQIKRFREIVETAGKITADFFAEIDWTSFRIVGITSSLNQLTSSLFFAKSIKNINPGLIIVLGGAGCAGNTGKSLAKTFPFIDFVINGEGELPFSSLVMHICEPEKYKLPDGIFTRQGDSDTEITGYNKTQIKDIATLPAPDFDDYFKELSQLPAQSRFHPVLPVEFSRGCWWNRCAFCNLNLQWKGYRAKSPQRMAEEIKYLSDRYQCIDFAFMDNALPRKTAKDFFELVDTHRKDYNFFAELRAVHSRQELALMARAGLKDVQVGIEALSGSLLKRLKKGTSLMDNVAVMRHSADCGLNLMGNLILHFPGSTEEQALETIRVLDFVWPYRPLLPVSFWLGMASPVCDNAAAHMIKGIKAHGNWNALFPTEVLKKLDMTILEYKADRKKQLAIWRKAHEKMLLWDRQRQTIGLEIIPLTFRDGGDFISIKQITPQGQTFFHRLSGTSRKIYISCLDPLEIDVLNAMFPNFSRDQILTFIKTMEAKKLMFIDDNRALSLAIQTKKGR